MSKHCPTTVLEAECGALRAEVEALKAVRPAALSMLDEILALEGIEAPGPGENAAGVVNDALEHLRERATKAEAEAAGLRERVRYLSESRDGLALAVDLRQAVAIRAELEVERLKGELVESRHMEGLALNAFDDKCEMVPDAQYQIAVAYGIDQCNRADEVESALTALRTRLEGLAGDMSVAYDLDVRQCGARIAAILAETKL